MLCRRITQIFAQTIKTQARLFSVTGSALKNMEKEQVVPDVVPKAPKGENSFVNHLNFCYFARQLFLSSLKKSKWRKNF